MDSLFCSKWASLASQTSVHGLPSEPELQGDLEQLGLEARTGCLVARETHLQLCPQRGWAGHSKSGGDRICLQLLLPQSRTALLLPSAWHCEPYLGLGNDVVIPSWHLMP